MQLIQLSENLENHKNQNDCPLSPLKLRHFSKVKERHEGGVLPSPSGTTANESMTFVIYKLLLDEKFQCVSLIISNKLAPIVAKMLLMRKAGFPLTYFACCQ